MSAAEIDGRWDHIDYLLRRESQFAAPGFEVDTAEEPSVRFRTKRTPFFIVFNALLSVKFLIGTCEMSARG
jgi:hypothetical protein